MRMHQASYGKSVYAHTTYSFFACALQLIHSRWAVRIQTLVREEGGMAKLVGLLHSPNEKLLQGAASALAALAANNCNNLRKNSCKPNLTWCSYFSIVRIQQNLRNLSIFPVLVTRLELTTDKDTQIACIDAISALLIENGTRLSLLISATTPNVPCLSS